MKSCTKCGVQQPLSCFGVDRQKRDGLTSHCKGCQRLASAKKRNPEKQAKYTKAYRERHPERASAAKKRWATNNRERVRELRRQWAKANPGKVLAMNRNAKARKRAAEGKHTKADIDALYALQRGKCAGCAQILGKRFHVDHILALAKGGTNDRRNLQLLCAGCNQTKGVQHVVDFQQSLGRLI